MKHIHYIYLLTILTCSNRAAQGAPSELPNPPAAMVYNLYEQVVARHPLGIPFGENEKVFAPYLSKTLLHQFDVTNACAADWLRQYPDSSLKPSVGLFEDGIFSGGSEQASPTAFHVEKTEVETDGSTRVHVKLTWQDAWNKPMFWYVTAVVVQENGRSVVEDVLFLKGNNRDIDWRLSKALSEGCVGPRWVGKALE